MHVVHVFTMRQAAFYNYLRLWFERSAKEVIFMKKLVTLFTGSWQELKQVRTITICAMLAAVGIALGSVSIQMEHMRISFAGIPVMISGYLFGPVVGSIFAGVLDILKYLVKPVGAFFPALTLVMVLKGCIYGCFFYRRPLSLFRVLAALFVSGLVCNVILNTLCLSVLYGKAFMTLLPPRILQNLILWPVDSLIFFHVSKLLEMAGVFRVFRKNKVSVN